LAAQQGHLTVVKCLVEQGADKDKTNNDGVSPLMIAAHQGHSLVVHYLLEQGVDVNKIANNGVTALHIAVYNGHAEIVCCLLQSGTSLTTKRRDGKLPIDCTANEEIKQLIRDEEKRRNMHVSNK